jgi:8-oxo-dGTP pyrophosphatase MutT (NUDIX family)
MGAILFMKAGMAALLAKAHVNGYTKGDGTYVAPHDTKVHAKGKLQVAKFDHKAPLPAEAFANVGAPAELPPVPAKPAPKPKQMALFTKPSAGSVVGAQYGGKPAATGWSKPWGKELGGEKTAPHYPNAITHPQEGDKGEDITINEPSKPSDSASWTDPQAIATFVPDGDVPAELNGVAIAPWEDAPTTAEGWASVGGQQQDLDEPLMPAVKLPSGKFKERAAGVIIEEPDGRVWVMCPTNQFGGYKATFPKGRHEPGLSFQATAIKECFEETGLQVEITGYHGDIERSTTVARYYTARRVGGSPAHMGWEAQAIKLVPKGQLLDVLNTDVDHKIMALGAPAGEESAKGDENHMKKDLH